MELHRAGAGAAGEGRDAAAAAARAERPAEEEEDGEEEEDDEDEDEDEEDTWLDRMLTRAALAALVAVVGAWGYMHLHIWAKGGGGVGPLRPLPVPPSVEL